MQTLCGAASKNKPGRPNEDALMTALGDLVARVEKGGPEAARAQDRLRVRDQQGHLFAVLDGVGAAPRGRDAAQDIAVALRTLYEPPLLPATEASVRELLRRSHERIHGWGFIPGTKREQGAAAATVAYFAPEERVVLLHAGDTRGYRWRPSVGELTRLTRDHTQGRAITNYIGRSGPLAVEEGSTNLDEGDWLVLVTDGVTKGLDDGAIAALLGEEPEPTTAATQLVEHGQRRAARAGVVDDTTALVVELVSWQGPAWGC